MAKVNIQPLNANERASWEELARGYKEFYETPTSDQEFETAWQRLLQQDGVFGLSAKLNGKMVGITHYLFHTTIWAPRSCYLQDLLSQHNPSVS